MRGWLIGLLALVAAPLHAQNTYSSLAPPVTIEQLNAVAATIPTAASSVPPGVADSGAIGASAMVYARADHTHASKARKGRVLVPLTGTLAVTFSPAFSGVPICVANAEATAGDTNVVNAQIDGTPTASGMTIRITRTAQSVVALLGLTILSVPTQIATYAHYICVEP